MRKDRLIYFRKRLLEKQQQLTVGLEAKCFATVSVGPAAD